MGKREPHCEPPPTPAGPPEQHRGQPLTGLHLLKREEPCPWLPMDVSTLSQRRGWFTQADALPAVSQALLSQE